MSLRKITASLCRKLFVENAYFQPTRIRSFEPRSFSLRTSLLYGSSALTARRLLHVIDIVVFFDLVVYELQLQSLDIHGIKIDYVKVKCE